MFGNAYNKTKVFITGHTGFKGTWLAIWLEALGADVVGFALPAPTQPNHFSHLDLSGETIIGDIRDREALTRAIRRTRPDILFHLAAQPLVRSSYRDPIETFTTNILGTVHVFEACRSAESVRAIVNVTSDKCYEDRTNGMAHREDDRLGGYDPYSCSKACAELVTTCYRRAYFAYDAIAAGKPLLASVRAGNVLGGGDWGEDRLLPDLVRAASRQESLKLRHPHAVRPWQHVLDALSGYLEIGSRLLAGDDACSGPWNFGPDPAKELTVKEVVEVAKGVWGDIFVEMIETREKWRETAALKLDTAKARSVLGWKPFWGGRLAVVKAMEWYRAFYENESIITTRQIQEYVSDAKASQASWASAQ